MSDPATVLAGDSFAALLRRLRLASGLTQEGLAERAGLSDRGISALERGVNRQPHLETVQLLANALQLTASQRAEFLAAARPDSLPAPPPAAPAGTLTFLLTEVEGSTALWERHEAAMRQALVRHDALLDEFLARHGGRRVQERGEGDATVAVFTDPTAAVAAALAIQRALLAELWPEGLPIRVRIGLHTGIAQLHGGDYYGPVVNRAALMRELGHGGQVLMGEATAALVDGRLPEGAGLRELGRHSLRGIGEPAPVYQLCHPDLPAEFPPLRSPQAPRHNLPASLSSFVGREAEQRELRAALEASRLVTLTGTGGVGKTRLALAVAGELLELYADGVWLVELADLREGALVAGALAGALGVREEPGRDLPATLRDHLRDRRLLLVLDNCEHLLAACAELGEALLRACAGLRVLATSREGLGVAGERLYRVPSLPVPDPTALPPLEELGRVEAVRLFVERAGARAAGFALTVQNAAAVAGICRRLEGIPLAIELAAGRAGGLPLEAIAARLERSVLLTGGPRTAPSRQQTLRGALDWSWELLDEPERIVLRRLAVCAGGSLLGAAEAVCAGEGLEAWEVEDLLGALVGKSLALLEEREGAEARYRLLEPVRQYAGEQLQAAGEGQDVQGRHLGWCVALAEEAAPQLTGPEQAIWLDRLEAEYDNLRAALTWGLRAGATSSGLQLAAALWRFWYVRGYLNEGRRWLGEALSQEDAAGAPMSLRALALTGVGVLAVQQGDYTEARQVFEESLAIRRDLGDRHSIAGSLNNLANVACSQDDYTRARALYEESLAIRRNLGDRQGIAMSLGNLGNAAFMLGDLAGAWPLYEESLAIRRELGDMHGVAMSLGNLGNVAVRQGDYALGAALHEESLAFRRDLGDRQGIAMSLESLGIAARRQGDTARARALYEEGLALSRDLGDRRGITISLTNLGVLAGRQGDYAGARALHRESLALSRDMGDRQGIAASLEGFALLAGVQGRPLLGAQLGGAADGLRRALGTPRPPEEQDEYDQAIVALRSALGEEGCEAAWAAGRAMPLDEAIALALEVDLAG